MTKDVRNSNNPLVEIGVDIGDKDECVISCKRYGEQRMKEYIDREDLMLCIIC